jgi:D-glycero-D-manno-heptose 1,7-bisphosphate phosphatase
MKEGNSKKKAVFLDRDGVINRETGGYIFKPEDFKLNTDIMEALGVLRDHGFILIIITNQGGIARGIYTHAHVHKVHETLRERFSVPGLEITEIYYCPHYPSSGKCLCRKPGSILIEKAIARFKIDPGLSWMIGDKESDTEAARRAGIRSILISPNGSLMNYIDIIIPGWHQNAGRAGNSADKAGQ